MQRNAFETMLGAFVLVIAIGFVFFFQKTVEIGSTSGYELNARFTSIEGIDRGTDVRVSGVKVGTITDYYLDKETYSAIVKMNINNGVELPYDTAAVITSESLLGGKFLALEPGGDMDMLKPGDMIEYTQSTPSIEKLLGQAIYSLSNNSDDDSQKQEATDTSDDE